MQPTAPQTPKNSRALYQKAIEQLELCRDDLGGSDDVAQPSQGWIAATALEAWAAAGAAHEWIGDDRSKANSLAATEVAMIIMVCEGGRWKSMFSPDQENFHSVILSYNIGLSKELGLGPVTNCMASAP
jgi:hypothetical protein